MDFKRMYIQGITVQNIHMDESSLRTSSLPTPEKGAPLKTDLGSLARADTVWKMCRRTHCTGRGKQGQAWTTAKQNIHSLHTSAPEPRRTLAVLLKQRRWTSPPACYHVLLLLALLYNESWNNSGNCPTVPWKVKFLWVSLWKMNSATQTV